MSGAVQLGDDRGAPPDGRRPPRQVSRRWRVGAGGGRALCRVPGLTRSRAGAARPGDGAPGAGPLLLVVDPEPNPPTLSA